jgi:3-hydroxyisobutyrate dehydrogenase-like beta-hydroxyacid dehydrogenase
MTSKVGTDCGFIGLGQMGAPMARRLTAESLWVYDVSADATPEFAAAGARVARSVRELTENCAHISVMVRDDAQVQAVVTELLPVASEGTVVAVHSTIEPDTARQLAPLAQSRGVHLLDAPVSGGAIGAKNGRLAILVGGSVEAFELSRPVLELMGDLVVHVGPIGAGTAAKLARNLVHFVAFTAVTEALVLAEAAGLDLPTLGKIVRHTDAITGGPGAIMWRDRAGPVAADDPWFPIFDHVRALGEKDLALAIQLGDELGVDTPLAELALTRLGPGLGVA